MRPGPLPSQAERSPPVGALQRAGAAHTAAQRVQQAHRTQLGRLVGEPQAQRDVEAQQQHTPAGGDAAARRLDRQQRLASARWPVEDDPRVPCHAVQGAELLLCVATYLFLDALSAGARALEEFEVGAQRSDDLLALRARRLAGIGVEAGDAPCLHAAPSVHEHTRQEIRQRASPQRAAVDDLP